MYTELELVNHILETLGEDTTPTLETSHPAVVQARSRLTSDNKEFQGKGWWFNKESNLKLLPDSDGRVRIPDETLTFRVTSCSLWARDIGTRFVKRGDFVYDTVEHTNILGVAVWTDITILLDIEDLPPSAGTYLKHFAAENAFLADDGDLGSHARLIRLTQAAWADIRNDEMKSVRNNALGSPFGKAVMNYPRTRQGTRNPIIVGG